MVVLGGRYLLIIAVVVFAVWRAVCWRRHGTRLSYEMVVALMFAWSLVVAYLAFFPVRIIFYDWHGRFSLIPLKSSIDMIRYSTVRTAVTNIGGNVLLFVPIGFLLPALFERLRRVWSLAWRAAVLSAVIEILQIPTQVRSTDVDDVILNVIGALVGLAVFRAVWALAGRRGLRLKLGAHLSSRSHREPLLIALVPFAIILVLTTAALVPKVVAGTLGRGTVGRSVVAGLPAATEVARTETGGYLFVIARGDDNGREVLRYSEFKKVLPGRFTQTATGDEVRAGGSGYMWSLTAYDAARGEKPVVYLWGRNDAGATSVILYVRGKTTDRAAIGRYFMVAFPYDDRADAAGDGRVDDLNFVFVDSAGDDITSRLVRW